MNRAHHAIFRSKTLGLIDTLKLTPEEVIGLALTLSAAFGAKLQRQQLHAMLDAAIDETEADRVDFGILEPVRDVATKGPA